MNLEEYIELGNELLPLITAMSKMVGRCNGKDGDNLYSATFTTDGGYININLGSNVSIVKTAGFPARIWVSEEDEIEMYDLEGEEC